MAMCECGAWKRLIDVVIQVVVRLRFDDNVIVIIKVYAGGNCTTSTTTVFIPIVVCCSSSTTSYVITMNKKIVKTPSGSICPGLWGSV